MSTITFDTFKFVDRLEKAGLSREQAAAIVEAQKDAFADAMDGTVATKADIRDVRSEIELMRSEMRSIELRLTIKLGAFMAASVGTTVALVKLL
jgi:hypothetical protein